MADITATTTSPSKLADFVSILEKLPAAPTSGFSTSEFAMFFGNALAIVGLNGEAILNPSASVSTTYAIEATVALVVFGVIYAFLRFVLKQSNINLLNVAVTAYRDVQVAAATANLPAQLP